MREAGSMITNNDAALRARLQRFWSSLQLVAAALCVSACSGGAPPAADIPSPGRWPPATRRHAERLGAAFSPSSDPLVWWKTTLYDSLPDAVYPGTLELQVARALIKETNKVRADNGLPP